MEKMPGGVWITLKGKVASSGQELIAIGYKYNSSKVLNFVMHPDFGTTRRGVPYEMKFVDPQGRFGFRNIDRPECLTQYYTYSNVVDAHNQLRQSELALEEKWVTTNPYMRLVTTLIGINVVDSMHMCKKYKMVPQNMTTMMYANVLAKQLLDMAMEKKELDVMRSVTFEQWPHLPAELGKLVNSQGKWLKKPHDFVSVSSGPCGKENSLNSYSQDTVSTMSTVPRLSRTNFVPGEIRRDKNGRLHELCITEPTGSGRKESNERLQQGSSTKKGPKKAKSYRPAKPCQREGCHYSSRFYCRECEKHFCAPYDSVERECFYWHVETMPEDPNRKRTRSCSASCEKDQVGGGGRCGC
jgi:hypothetical protein